MEKSLPSIPAKRYFTIGEVSELCGVKPYVLRYWEQEFTQLKPMKRRGNRRYYQHHEVLLIRRIRELLYDQGFTISGARNRLADTLLVVRAAPETNGHEVEPDVQTLPPLQPAAATPAGTAAIDGEADAEAAALAEQGPQLVAQRLLRAELLSIRELLNA
jgi:DNA-binding transcriptional MerR regulator